MPQDKHARLVNFLWIFILNLHRQLIDCHHTCSSPCLHVERQDGEDSAHWTRLSRKWCKVVKSRSVHLTSHTSIIESVDSIRRVDSICRDSADTQYMLIQISQNLQTCKNMLKAVHRGVVLISPRKAWKKFSPSFFSCPDGLL